LQVAELAMEKGFYNGYSWLAERRRKRLTGEFIALAKNIAPDAEIANVMIPGYEELDAWIDIVVPDEKEEEVSEALSQLRDKVLEHDGLYIGLGITERSQYEAVQSKLGVTV
jgi:hypothetical protein